jgi:transposase-like protein
MQPRKHHSPEQKVLILRELLENNVPISQLAEKYGVHVNDIYNWRKKLFEGAPALFTGQRSTSNQSSQKDKVIQSLNEKLHKRDEAISYLLRETIELKKNIVGEI